MEEESIDSLMNEIRARLELMESNLPTRVEPKALSRTAKLPFKAMSYREFLIWRMAELSRVAFESFDNEKLAAGIVLTRAAVETSAALWYLRARISDVLDSEVLGNLDEHLMRMLLGSKSNPDLPQPINVLTFVDRVDKEVKGFRRQYDILSEFAHPNWSGTMGLYSQLDRENLWMDVGLDSRRSEGPKRVGVLNLSVVLHMFEVTYNRLGDLMPDFIRLCEAELVPK